MWQITRSREEIQVSGLSDRLCVRAPAHSYPPPSVQDIKELEFQVKEQAKLWGGECHTTVFMWMCLPKELRTDVYLL